MPAKDVVELVSSMKLDSESINTWKNGVERSLEALYPQRHQSQGQVRELRIDLRWSTRRDACAAPTAGHQSAADS
ncbi:MAG: hypothetical protein MZV63_50580 [Marinilabiliales bacterium]|nr:hypothetical protein [Marinilabiliales bacterium]